MTTVRTSPTFMLTHWVRDRADGRLPLEWVVRKMTSETAALYGLGDRGVLAPGMLGSHYAPRTRLRLDATDVRPGEALLAFGPALPAGAECATRTLNLSPRDDLIEAAANLFSHLRALDAVGAAAIAVMPIPQDGLGEAINDRLTRAAAPRRGE